MLLVPFVLATALGACATTALSPERITSSEAAIQSADAVSAGKIPAAALHVRLAQEELAQAKAFAKDGDAARAELFLQRSAADSELALALARQADAQADADKAKAALRTVEGKSS